VDEDGRPLFTMGRWGTAVNAVAVVYQLGMVVNLLWPRAVIYDLTGETWWLQWSALLFVGLTLLIGAGYFGLRRLHATIDLAHVPHTAAISPGLDAEPA
jgi:hypothetical protein